VTQSVDSYQVIRTIPHDTRAFTQGLTFDPQSNGSFFYESTGWRGQSDVRKVDIATGEVLMIRPTADQYFGEGVAYYTEFDKDENEERGRLIHITWTSQQGFIFDAETLEVVREFQFSTARNEGWGITYNPHLEQFIVSDGSQVHVEFGFVLLWYFTFNTAVYLNDSDETSDKVLAYLGSRFERDRAHYCHSKAVTRFAALPC
jgi:glutamine cyclotransferase